MKVKEVMLNVIQNQKWTSLRPKDYMPVEKPIKLDRPMTNKEYVDQKGLACPFCSGEDIDWGDNSYEVDHSFQEAYCQNCEAEWYDKFTRVGYVVTRKPE